MRWVAWKMLTGDRAKYLMLVSGLTFAALLMTEQAAIFCGIMRWAGSTLDNVGAPIWVVDPMVEQVNDTEALRDTDLNRVRSVEGVASRAAGAGGRAASMGVTGAGGGGPAAASRRRRASMSAAGTAAVSA